MATETREVPPHSLPFQVSLQRSTSADPAPAGGADGGDTTVHEIPWQISLQRANAEDTAGDAGGSTCIDYAVNALSVLPMPADDLFG